VKVKLQHPAAVAQVAPRRREGNNVDYEQIPRPALIRLLQEHDAALLEAGKDGIVMSYSGRAEPR